MKPTIDKKATGLHIKQIMDEKHISAYDLSKMLGVSALAVYKYINGTNLPTTLHLYQMAFILGTTMDELLIGDS